MARADLAIFTQAALLLPTSRLPSIEPLPLRLHCQVGKFYCFGHCYLSTNRLALDVAIRPPELRHTEMHDFAGHGADMRLVMRRAVCPLNRAVTACAVRLDDKAHHLHTGAGRR
jgi:hypothetical protein